MSLEEICFVLVETLVAGGCGSWEGALVVGGMDWFCAAWVGGVDVSVEDGGEGGCVSGGELNCKDGDGDDVSVGVGVFGIVGVGVILGDG